MEKVDESELYQIARRTLGIPPYKNSSIPPGYLEELRKHVNFNKEDTNFRVFPQIGRDYGIVQCLEQECGGVLIKLNANGHEDVNEGIGSLAAFRMHAVLPRHVNSLRVRLQQQPAVMPKTNIGSNSNLMPPSSVNFGLNAEKEVAKESSGIANFKVKKEEDSSSPIMEHFWPTQLKREGTPSSDEPSDPFSDGFPFTKPLKRPMSDYETDITVPQSSSPLGCKRPKVELSGVPSSDTELPSFVLNPPLSQRNLNLHTPHLTSLINHRPMNIPNRHGYGDVQESDDEDHPNIHIRDPNELNKFIIEAGNSEFFDGNASVDKALEMLGLKKLGESLPFMTVPLLPHQVIGVCWMLERERGSHKGGILADEMGLGKTVQMIATMVQHRSDDPAVKSTLICAPVALLDQWKLEVEMKTGGALSCMVYHGATKAKSLKELQKYDVVITTYGTLSAEWPDDPNKTKRRSKASNEDFISTDDEVKVAPKKIGLIMRSKWFRVVLDEAQSIRNRQTLISNVVTNLNSKYRWCLTGTPVINTLTDCYGLLRFRFVRGVNGPTLETISDVMNAVIVGPCLTVSNKGLMKITEANLATIRLQAILNTCLLRRKKDSTLDGKKLIELPPKEVYLDELTFSQDERNIYNVVEKRSQVIFNRYLRAGTVLKNYTNILVLLLRLRQLCSHPSLIQENADTFVRPEDDLVVKEEDLSELHRAITNAGKEYVEKLKEKRKEIALKRIEAEKASVDATIEVEDCPICFDAINTPVITICNHSFCKDCLALVLSQPPTANEHLDYAAAGRPCPTCRTPIQKETTFLRSAFEPNDIELGLAKGSGTTSAVDSDMDDSDDDGMPIDPSVWNSNKAEEAVKNDDTEILSTNTRAKRKTSRRSYAEYGSDADDDLSDFIVHSDEEDTEEERDRSYGPKKHSSRKKKIILSDNEDDEEEILPPQVVKRRMRKLKGPRRKFLPSAKMIKMMELLKSLAEAEETKNEKTVVVSQWTSCLDLVADYLEENGFTFVRYQGGMSRAQRDQAVRIFMANGKARVMLMSLKGGGTGLNLTRANHVIALDLGWSPAVEHQAFDRVHRLGQSRNVIVNRLVIEDTVEARILALQEKKQILMDGSLGEGKATKLGRLSVRDLANLFGLGV